MNIRLITLSILLLSTLNANNQYDDLFDMSLEELMNIEIQGSTKTLQTKLSVPSSVTVFTQKEIKNLGVTTLRELKNYVPGFSSKRSSSSSLMYNTATRGNMSGDSSRDILVLLDGQRLNTDYNGGSELTRPILSLENIKKVEFIRGPGSALYGSNAFSAVVNLTSISGKNLVNFRLGTNGLQVLSLVSYKENDLIIDGFVKAIKDDGQKYTNPVNTKDLYDSFELYLKMKYNNFSIFISHNQQEAKEFYILKLPSNDNNTKGKNSYIRMAYDWKYSENFSSSLAISFSQSSTDIFLEQNPSLNPSLYVDAKIEEQTPSIEWFNNYVISDNHSFQFGAEYRRPNMINLNVLYNYDVYTSSPPSYTPEYTKYPLGIENSRDIFGIYMQYQGKVYDYLYITLGLRYDDYSDFGSSTNPRTALVYEYTQDTSFKFLYSSAFRAPSRNELNLQNNGILLGNPDLKAETIDSYEFVVINKFNKHQLSLSVFRNDLKNIITDVSLENGVLKRDNSSSYRFEGIELEYDAILMKNFQARLSFSHLFEMPDESFRVSKNLASMILNYNFNSYNFNLNGYFHDKIQNNYNGVLKKIDSYYILNTKIAYKYNNSLSVYMQANNILDEDYYSSSYSSSDTVDIPNRGLEAFVGLEYNF